MLARVAGYGRSVYYDTEPIGVAIEEQVSPLFSWSPSVHQSITQLRLPVHVPDPREIVKVSLERRSRAITLLGAHPSNIFSNGAEISFPRPMGDIDRNCLGVVVVHNRKMGISMVLSLFIQNHAIVVACHEHRGESAQTCFDLLRSGCDLSQSLVKSLKSPDDQTVVKIVDFFYLQLECSSMVNRIYRLTIDYSLHEAWDAIPLPPLIQGNRESGVQQGSK